METLPIHSSGQCAPVLKTATGSKIWISFGVKLVSTHWICQQGCCYMLQYMLSYILDILSHFSEDIANWEKVTSIIYQQSFKLSSSFNSSTMNQASGKDVRTKMLQSLTGYECGKWPSIQWHRWCWYQTKQTAQPRYVTYNQATSLQWISMLAWKCNDCIRP